MLFFTFLLPLGVNQTLNMMDRTKIVNDYMATYNEATAKYKADKIPALVEEINAAIKRSEMAEVNPLYERISVWNNYISNIEGTRNALKAYDKTLKLPSIIEFLIVYDHINREWRFNTETY